MMIVISILACILYLFIYFYEFNNVTYSKFSAFYLFAAGIMFGIAFVLISM